MLSRVAERIYWMSRYLERVENTARLMRVYTNLLLDMPTGVDLGWFNLITLNAAESWFDARYKVRDERNVMKFLLSDPDYPGAMVSAMGGVRENIRTSRDVVPSESWEYINELHLYVHDNLQSGINRGSRHEFITNVIKGCQNIQGLLTSTMSEGQPKAFQRLGRNLERADMTTRLLDAGAFVVQENAGNLLPTVEQIIWVNVLNSASASLPYTKSVRKSVSGVRAATYLLGDTDFPRALGYSLEHMRAVCATLPRSYEVIGEIEKLQAFMKPPADDQGELCEDFRDYLNALQLRIGALHHLFAETWFTLD